MQVFILLSIACDELAHEGYDATEIVEVFDTYEKAVAYICDKYPNYKYRAAGEGYPECWYYDIKEEYVSIELVILEKEVN